MFFVGGGALACQSSPSQTAAPGCTSLFGGALLPTVTHDVAVEQETSMSPHAEGWVSQKLVSFQDFQAWPFQVSTMGPDPRKPVPLMTAHMPLLGQLGAVAVFFGAGAMACHVAPSHTTAVDRPTKPSATQNARVGQDTPASPSPGGSFS